MHVFRRDPFGVCSLLLVLSGASLMTACGGASNAPDATKTVTVTAPAPSRAIASATEEETTPPPSPSDPAEESSSGPVLPTEAAGVPLKLASFFLPADVWQENRFDVADRKDELGIGSELIGCGPDYANVLELRLANNFTGLAFTAGQANESHASNQSLTVEVMGNGKQLDIRSIPFNKVQPFTVPVKDVNAVQVLFYLDDEVENCGQGSVQAVLSNAVLTT